MPYATFDTCPETGYSYSDDFPVSVRMDGDYKQESRTLLAPISRRVWAWNLTLDDCASDYDRQTVQQFFVELRQLQFDPFLIKDPVDYARTGISLTLVGGTTYTLPTTIADEDYRHYPIDDANLIAYDAGTPATVSSVDTDGRTITLAAPPGGAVTLDCHAYRLARVDAPFQMQHQGGLIFITSVNIKEILRD